MLQHMHNGQEQDSQLLQVRHDIAGNWTLRDTSWARSNYPYAISVHAWADDEEIDDLVLAACLELD